MKELSNSYLLKTRESITHSERSKVVDVTEVFTFKGQIVAKL
jgi:hypothetical protein